MNKTSEQKPTIGPASPGDATQPNREPGQEAAQDTPDDDIKGPKGPHTTIPAKDDDKAPWHAAKGNDEVMSQKQNQKQNMSQKQKQP